MKKILLIEDNYDIRQNTAEILELSNYKVFLAENGKIGVEMAMEFCPDLIICDIMMPVLDGYGVLHAVHKNDLIRNTPFIFLTAKTERSDLRKGMELGADDFVTKPFSGTELLNAVDSRLNKIGLLKEELSIDLEGHQNFLNVSEDKNSLQSLIADRNINFYKKKQVIYTQGNHPNRLYYLLKGKVKTFKRNEDGKELVTNLFCSGDFLGYIALMEESIYKDTAEALEESELAVIPKEEFEELLNNNKEVSRSFIGLLAKNISNKENQLLGLAYNSLRKKVAEALILLQRKFKVADEDNFVIEISRESLATIAGTATESLIRTLSDFRNEKMIEIKDGTIVIVNLKKIQHLLN